MYEYLQLYVLPTIKTPTYASTVRPTAAIEIQRNSLKQAVKICVPSSEVGAVIIHTSRCIGTSIRYLISYLIISYYYLRVIPIMHGETDLEGLSILPRYFTRICSRPSRGVKSIFHDLEGAISLARETCTAQ